jgi:hypothetical protein
MEVPMYEKYDKNDTSVWVRNDLKNRQKEFCMCWDCAQFQPETEHKGCPIIHAVLTLAVEKKIVLPVWECPSFQAK